MISKALKHQGVADLSSSNLDLKAPSDIVQKQSFLFVK